LLFRKAVEATPLLKDAEKEWLRSHDLGGLRFGLSHPLPYGENSVYCRGLVGGNTEHVLAVARLLRKKLARSASYNPDKNLLTVNIDEKTLNGLRKLYPRI